MRAQGNRRYCLVALIILFAIGGCAYRSVTPNRLGEFEPVYNLYSRNFIVAAPTAAANFVCGVAGGIAVGAMAPGGDAMAGGAVIGAHACGAIVGLPFIPVSYLCAENPWYIEHDQFHSNWQCRASVNEYTQYQVE